MQVNLLGRAQEEVASADNFRDAHQGIIDHDGQLISPRSILAPQDVVAAVLRQVHLLPAIVPIGESNDLIGDKEANGSRGVSRRTRRTR